MSSTIPATVGRLYDGTQLVKRVHLKWGATKVVQTSDAPPQRLQELDDSLDNGPRRPLPFSIWEQSSWGGTDFLSEEEWAEEFGADGPPPASILQREGKLPVVVVRYADYQKTGSRVG